MHLFLFTTHLMHRAALLAIVLVGALTVLAAPLPQAADASSRGSATLAAAPESGGCITYDGGGFAADGYDRAGFDSNGMDQGGYGKDGALQRAGRLDKAGNLNGAYALDKDGYDSNGFNLAGFDKDGYNALGFDKDGYNRQGYDRNGYDKDNRDSKGNSCSSTSSDSSSADPKDMAALGIDLPELSDQMGPLPFDTAAFVGDAQPTETGGGPKLAADAPVATGAGQAAAPTAVS
ncbi:hypothetical protein DMC30DRAFT_420225 [Rhodotorula diobovata]|uniref:Uncharacterized protein n=1 Tax=Rhodotorula diobovata TaxID=5288 RepID=A0A5C5FJT3_9BASI|nr:hypothetical protein DMC30DRAFT_420225 [Rhodotorula diobovata]